MKATISALLGRLSACIERNKIKEIEMSHKNQIEIYQFNSRAKYWLVRADGGKYYDDFKYNHFISIHHNQVTLADL